MRDVLIKRLHRRFQILGKEKEVILHDTDVNNHAITKMSKRLSGWKSKAKKEMLDKPYALVKERWSSIKEDDWNLFKKNCNSEQEVVSMVMAMIIQHF